MASAEAPPVRCQGLAALLDRPHTAGILPLRGIIMDSPHGSGDALREGVEVIATFEDERRWRRPDLA
jgi:hypothetical protein